MRIKILFLLIILLLGLNYAEAQTHILIYQEDFEDGAPGVTLNAAIGDTSKVKNNYGINQWIINNKYNGSPLYPNTPNENQTSTGKITDAPYSHYLHIYDKNASLPPDTIASCNYNPTDSSNRFVEFPGVCTLGISNVEMTFFYTGEGSSTAYAELYYSTNNGTTWITTGTKYYNQPIWKYEVVTNPDFDNRVFLMFGFRWVNNAGALPGNTSFGIDDIYIEGDFDNSKTDFNLVIDSVTPNPVCQDFTVNIHYHLTAAICGEGWGGVELSDSTGSFASTPIPTQFNAINNEDTVDVKYNVIPFTIPSTTPPGSCYKILIYYYYNYYSLSFNSKASVCIKVKHCQNTILTVQPVITMSTDSVCVGSHILVPFWSTGVFKEDNKYIAQLSDSAGNFPSSPNIIGTSPDPNTYDPALVPSPGNVGGIISESKTNPVPNGCNYYIRVVSTDPVTVGAVWGPFCIKHCDIETNHKVNIQACLHSCAVGPEGFNTNVYVKIHDYDSSAIYNSANQFEVELLDPQFFTVVSVGAIGTINATNDTTMKVHIPCADSLANLGLKPGMYYMRIIATMSSHPMNTNGTIIILTIGAPSDNLYIYQYPNDSVFCVGANVYFIPEPDNAGPTMFSTYQWYLNGEKFSTDPILGIIFESQGTFTVTVQETNFGCKGPVTPLATKLTILGPPNVSITGPNDICLKDTIHYNIAFQKDVFYQWTSSGGKIIDTSNNILNIRFDTAGVYVVKILAVNKCGQATGTKNILATAPQDAKFKFNPPVCNGAYSIFTATNTTPPSITYVYNWNFDGGIATPTGNNPGPEKVSWKKAGKYKIKLTVTDNGCASMDTNTVDVLQTPVPLFDYTNKCFDIPTAFKDSSMDNPNSWLWNFGDNTPASTLQNPTHLYTALGNYNVSLLVTTKEGCSDTLVKQVTIQVTDDCQITIPNVFTPNNDGLNDVFFIKGLDNFPESRLLIYNRWGDKIYENDNYQNDWDGDNHSDGAYFYILILKTGTTLHGTVSIIR